MAKAAKAPAGFSAFMAKAVEPVSMSADPAACPITTARGEVADHWWQSISDSDRYALYLCLKKSVEVGLCNGLRDNQSKNQQR